MISVSGVSMPPSSQGRPYPAMWGLRGCGEGSRGPLPLGKNCSKCASSKTRPCSWFYPGFHIRGCKQEPGDLSLPSLPTLSTLPHPPLPLPSLLLFPFLPFPHPVPFSPLFPSPPFFSPPSP